jgi:hypothetical protein
VAVSICSVTGRSAVNMEYSIGSRMLP